MFVFRGFSAFCCSRSIYCHSYFLFLFCSVGRKTAITNNDATKAIRIRSQTFLTFIFYPHRKKSTEIQTYGQKMKLFVMFMVLISVKQIQLQSNNICTKESKLIITILKK